MASSVIAVDSWSWREISLCTAKVRMSSVSGSLSLLEVMTFVKSDTHEKSRVAFH